MCQNHLNGNDDSKISSEELKEPFLFKEKTVFLDFGQAPT